MFEEEKDKQDKEELEARENIAGFFELLLKVDMRVNPELYKPNKEKDYARHNNNGN